jgi:hypothetical protein
VDQGQLIELRRWATRLQETSASEESRAAGRAILMLADEVERLGLRLAAAQSAVEEAAREATAGAEDEWEAAAEQHGVKAWFRRTLGMDAPLEEPEPGEESPSS